MATLAFNTWLLACLKEIFMHVVFDLKELRVFKYHEKKKKVSELPEHQTSPRGFFYSGINPLHIPAQNMAKLDRTSPPEDGHRILQALQSVSQCRTKEAGRLLQPVSAIA